MSISISYLDFTFNAKENPNIYLYLILTLTHCKQLHYFKEIFSSVRKQNNLDTDSLKAMVLF